MLIFGIESSCDETSASLVCAEKDGFKVLSNKIASQIDIHKLYGGVVPEIASRAHTEAVSRLSSEALCEAGVRVDDIDAVAVTSEPGLIGALLVGVNFAKSFAYINNKPLIGVNHIKGHIAANYLSPNPPKPPFLAFVASGGHTSLISVRDYTDMEIVGATRDDAMGEAFDKSARLLGIPYPGGAALDRLAYEGNAFSKDIKLPSAALEDGSCDFSFSGIKTAVMNLMNNASQKGIELPFADIAACFSRAAVDSAVKQTARALDKTGATSLVLAGGVAANSHLRTSMKELCERRGCELFLPPPSLCGDNAAMICAQGYYELMQGARSSESLNPSATSRREIWK